MISLLLSLLNNFIFKASFVATTTSQPVSFVCCCRTSCRRRGGAAALLSSSAAVHKLIMKSPPSSGSRPPRLMAPVTSSSHELQLLNPSPQFAYDPHSEVLILAFLSLVLLVRLAKELVKLLRYLLLLSGDFIARRGREPIIIPPRDAQLQAVAESTTVEFVGIGERDANSEETNVE
ncbi:hypothetical protein CY35_02G004900 [Sphagnum magellanicum]|nr:hypothetical protein CY35_02G004900 [Sphagnum magellanicum]